MGSQTAAGTSLAISATGPATHDAAGYAALTFVDIGQVEKLGSFGATFAKSEFQPLKGAKQKYKGSADNGAIQPSIAIDSADAGQTLLQTAAEDETQKLYSFRVTFQDGAKRYFRGRVFGSPETADGADSMLMSTPTVEISTRVVKVAPGAMGSITAMGDSIVAGEFNPSGPATYAALNRLGYGTGVTIVNKAVSGESTQTGYSRLQSGDYDAGVVANGPSVFVVEDGTNSLANFGGNISETALYAIVTNIVTLAKTKGFYVMICTLLPRTVGGVDSWSTTQEAKRLAYNNLVRNNAAGADGIIDQALNPTMGDAANSTGNTVLYKDGLHPTNAGQDALIPTWKTAIDTLISMPRRLPALKTLSLSGALTNGTASTGTIIGAAFGSTITSNVPGLTVNSAARTYTWDGTGAVSTIATGLIETLTGAPGSPNPSSVTVVAAGAAKNFLRLAPITRLTESAGANGGYDYTPTVTLTGSYSPTAGGYSAATIPANADGYVALQIPAAGPGGPIMGVTNNAAPASLADIGFGIYSDTAATGKYLYIVDGQSSYADADPTPITIAANDIMRVRRTGAIVYLEVSKDGGSTFQVAKSRSVGTGKLVIYFQTGSSSAQGIIRAPYASANVA